MAKLEFESLEMYARELRISNIKAVGIKGITETVPPGQVRLSVLLTAFKDKEKGIGEDFYLCQEYLGTKPIQTDQEYTEFLAELEKRSTEIMALIQKEAPSCRIIRGRFLP